MDRKTPQIRCQKQPNGRHRAYCVVDRTRVYLGPWGSPQASRRHADLLDELRRYGTLRPARGEEDETCLAEVFLAFFRHAKRKYSADELYLFQRALEPIEEQWGDARPEEFGSTQLRRFKQQWISQGLARRTVNHFLKRVRIAYKWMATEKLIPVTVYHEVLLVPVIQKGEKVPGLNDPDDVPPVEDEIVEATLKHVTPTVADMLRLMRLTGMRSGEVCRMTLGQIDLGDEIWLYRPRKHKTASRGHERIVAIGPKAQQILRPYLSTDLERPLFSPRRAMAEWRAEQHAQRKTPVQPSQRARAQRAAKRKSRRKEPGEWYTPSVLSHAVYKACRKAFAEPEGLTEEESNRWRLEHWWHPHQLRHSAATQVAAEHGDDTARIVLGHRSLQVTAGYVRPDIKKAVVAARLIG